MGFRAVATKKKPENATEDLFADYPEPDRRRSTASFEPLRVHIWSETKAQLIRNYLEYFGWVTRHGCYIDGFAGPQNPEERDGWSAYLALSIRPTLIRNFHLCERNRNSFQLLTQLRNAQPSTKGRTINLYRGDFNRQVHSILEAGHLTNTNATFALLDQRTFQCHWRTVTALASRKGGRYKIELFYFFPKVGVPGEQVTFIGVGFGAGVSSVAFTGAQSQNFTFNATTVTATVPIGTMTGTVT